MKPALDLFIDANILLFMAFCLWRVTQAILVHTRLRHNYGLQLTLLKTMLCITLLSPVLAHFVAMLSERFAPNTPLTVSDLAVAAFLKGEVALSATDFQWLLNTRGRILDMVYEGRLPLWALVLLALLVLAGSAIVGRAVFSLWHLNRSVRTSFLWRRTANVDIRVSDTVDVPFASRGVFRRYVILPSSCMTRPADLRIALAHEFQHLRTGDVEWEFAFEFLRPLLFWNPAFVLWKTAFDRLRELGCDQEVMLTRRISARDYSNCLLDFCERRVSGAGVKVMNVALVRSDASASRRALETRILAIHDGAVPTGGGAFLYVAVFLLLVGGVLAAASVRQPGDWSHDRLMLSTIANLERLELINNGSVSVGPWMVLNPRAD